MAARTDNTVGRDEDRRISRGAKIAMGGTFSVFLLMLCYWIGMSMGLFPRNEFTPSELSMDTLRQMALTRTSAVLADTDSVWSSEFLTELETPYKPPDMAYINGKSTSACGTAYGTYYCPRDRHLYLDTEFLATVLRDAGEAGELATTYVVARQVSFHVLNELGVITRTQFLQQRASSVQSRSIAKRQALQAECIAAIWARRARGRIGDIAADELLRIMRLVRNTENSWPRDSKNATVLSFASARGSIHEHHRWFMRGYQSGRVPMCDALKAEVL